MSSNIEQMRNTLHQLCTEVGIKRKKVSEVSKDLIDYCEHQKQEDCLVTGPTGQNPFAEKKSCSVL